MPFARRLPGQLAVFEGGASRTGDIPHQFCNPADLRPLPPALTGAGREERVRRPIFFATEAMLISGTGH
jgi:hypothetical protein